MPRIAAPRFVAPPLQQRATPAVASIDLNALSLSDPFAAQVGYVLNDGRQGGVDLDGNPFALTLGELLVGARRLSPWLGPNELAAIERLRALLVWSGTAWQAPQAPAPAQGGAAGSPIAVALPRAQPLPGRAVAHGGFRLEATAAQGTAKLLLPFPTSRAHQRVDDLSQLQVVDARGAPVDAIANRRFVDVAPERRVLVVDLDLARLPRPAFLRWSVRADVREDRVDTSRPAPIPLFVDLADDVAQFLDPAPMIQKDAPEIAAIAARVRARSVSVQDVVQNALGEIAALRKDWSTHDGSPFDDDALSFARTGYGECVAHANLFAAICRACDVPARVVAGVSRGNGYALNMHYQNEWYLPGAGWVHVEPQGTQVQTSRVDMVQTAVLSKETEAHGYGLDGYSGVPMGTMSPVEVDEDLRAIDAGRRRVVVAAALEAPGSGMPAGLHGAT